MARRVELDLLEQDATTAPPQDEPAGEQGQVPEVPVPVSSRFRNLLRNALCRLKRPDVAFNWKSLLSWKALVSAGTEEGQASEVRVSLFFRFRNLLLNTLGRFKRPDVAFNWKSLLTWKVLVPAAAAAVLLVTVSVAYVLSQKQEAARVAAEHTSQAASTVPVVREAAFADFSIDIKDAQGRYRFLQCDVTVEFQSGVELTEDRKVEIRKVIYLAAKKKGPELIRVSESGDRFKKEMRDELRDLLGEGALKDIYITRYVLI
jgi:flagellar basal body-associated protein FliL